MSTGYRFWKIVRLVGGDGVGVKVEVEIGG